MRALIIAPILAISLPSVANAQPQVFRGGVFDGLRAERTPRGRMLFVPGAIQSRPPTTQQRAAIEAFIELARHGGDLAGVTIGTLAPGTQGMEDSFREVAAQCARDEPYSITATVVRVSWRCDAYLSWISIIDFSSDEIVHVRFARAFVPVAVEAPPSTR